MSNRRNTELRRRVYALAVDGHCPAYIAKIMGRPHNTIQYHVDNLELEGALIRNGTTTPALYRRGPNHTLYEIGNQIGNSPSSGWSPPPPQTIHRPWFRCKVNGPPPEDLKWWDKERVMNNTVIRKRKFVLHNARLATIFTFNDKTALIMLDPIEIPLETADKAEEIKAGFAWEVIRLAKIACKMELGIPIPTDEVHYAEYVPGLEGVKMGHIPVTDTSWFDDSPGGRPEWESTDLEEKIVQHQAGRRIINLEKVVVKELAEIKEAVVALAASQKEVAQAVVSLTTTITDLIKGPKDLKMKEMDELDNRAYR